jgi:hypothetical protein
MGGRGTYASGKNVAFQYETVGYIEGIKVLEGIKGSGKENGFPEESHRSEAYIKLHSDGSFKMIRFYGEDRKLKLEIAYHREPQLDKKAKAILHYHRYDENFNRSKAAKITDEMYEKYKKYFKGVKR